MPAFVTSATTIAVPPYVMPGGLDVAVVEFDVLPVAVGTQGTGIVTVTGTAAGVPVEETISIPLEVVAEAPSSQGSALPSLPALHNFMQLGLALLLFGAGAIWLRTNPLQARER